MNKTLLWVAMAIAMLANLANASVWDIDTGKTVVEFKVKNMKVFSVKGTFKSVIGEVVVDDKDTTKSIVSAEIDAKTVNTGIEKRDEHLRTVDFLDVANHNKMKFVSNRMVWDKNRLKIHGNLTIRGITKGVVLDAGDQAAIEKALKEATHCKITATTEINRIDFGVDNSKFLSSGIGDNVRITLNIELVKRQAN
jgi:polyisoprenoid-binding protein YceI